MIVKIFLKNMVVKIFLKEMVVKIFLKNMVLKKISEKDCCSHLAGGDVEVAGHLVEGERPVHPASISICIRACQKLSNVSQNVIFQSMPGHVFLPMTCLMFQNQK